MFGSMNGIASASNDLKEITTDWVNEMYEKTK